MKNKGKQFEQDFQESCKSQLSLIRLKDPGSSFNIKCAGCPKQITRFSPRNICDFIGYLYPNMFLLELKSTKGTSMPFKNIIKSKTDKRLQQMVHLSEKKGIKAYIVFNWRKKGGMDTTVAVSVVDVRVYIDRSERKSIPFGWTVTYGTLIKSHKKITRYSYDLTQLIG